MYSCGSLKNAYKILVGKPQGRPRPRWQDNVKMDLTELGRDCVDWIQMA
jgi:hypothetical protein